jgi:hypothetical protein
VIGELDVIGGQAGEELDHGVVAEQLLDRRHGERGVPMPALELVSVAQEREGPLPMRLVVVS